MERVVVVGSGFSGAVLAREIAEKLNKKVLVLEKRSQIAGNMYDEMDEHGIRIQKYGPHVLVTNEWKVIEYLSQFSEMTHYNVKELSIIDGQYVRLPFNFESVQQMLGFKKSEIVINKMRKLFPNRDRVPIQELCACEDADVRSYANMLFEKSFRTYCAKQWGIDPEKLDSSIMGRSAFAMSYDERYMNKDFQFLPTNGFTSMFERMLDHPNIEVKLNVDAMEALKMDSETHTISYDGEKVELLVFTGALDELFREKYGELPYRALDITYEWFDVERKYPEKIISCPQAEGYTRKTEYKFFMEDTSGIKGTVIATEYPSQYVKGKSIAPFYPVITEETKARYAKYQDEATNYPDLFLCGRLAEFRYYNMDDCILHAFDIFNQIEERYRET